MRVNISDKKVYHCHNNCGDWYDFLGIDMSHYYFNNNDESKFFRN